MPAEHTYDYSIIRIVPRVERGEQVNVGVILSCVDMDFLEARIEIDEARLLALDPEQTPQDETTELKGWWTNVEGMMKSVIRPTYESAATRRFFALQIDLLQQVGHTAVGARAGLRPPSAEGRTA